METVEGAIYSYLIDSIGQRENKGNQGFKDPKFDTDMRELGRFQNGWAWCVCFCEMVWKKAFKDFIILVDPALKKDTVECIDSATGKYLGMIKGLVDDKEE